MMAVKEKELDEFEADKKRLDLLEWALADGQVIHMYSVDQLYCTADSEDEVVVAVGCAQVVTNSLREALDKIRKL